MIKDALATFSAAQASTVSVAHTDKIDTVAAGQSYVGSWAVFQISTAFTQIGTASRLQFQLQTSSVENFGAADDVTLATSQTYTTSQLSAGKVWYVRIPPGARRYIRAYTLISGGPNPVNAFSAGAWNSFIASDIDIDLDKRYLLGQY